MYHVIGMVKCILIIVAFPFVCLYCLSFLLCTFISSVPCFSILPFFLFCSLVACRILHRKEFFFPFLSGTGEICYGCYWLNAIGVSHPMRDSRMSIFKTLRRNKLSTRLHTQSTSPTLTHDPRVRFSLTLT